MLPELVYSDTPYDELRWFLISYETPFGKGQTLMGFKKRQSNSKLRITKTDIDYARKEISQFVNRMKGYPNIPAQVIILSISFLGEGTKSDFLRD